MYGFPTDKRKKWLAQVSRGNLTTYKDYNNKQICEVIMFKHFFFTETTPLAY